MFNAGDDLTAAALNAIGGNWTDYTVAWGSGGTPPAIGNGSKVGRYCLVGKLVMARINLVMGSTTTYGTAGFWTFSLPFTAATVGVTGNLWPGIVQDLDLGTGYKLGVAQIASGANVVTPIDPATANFYTFNVPQTWAAGDQLHMQVQYEIP